MSQETKHFLVVENDGDDAFFIKKAFDTIPSCTAFICRNTSEARAYLKGAGLYSDRLNFPIPIGVITDLRLGNESGLDFIKWLAESNEFNKIPLMLLTGSASEVDVKTAYALGVKQVFFKPADSREFHAIISEIIRQLCAKRTP